jgi:hypothetical protein
MSTPSKPWHVEAVEWLADTRNRCGFPEPDEIAAFERLLRAALAEREELLNRHEQIIARWKEEEEDWAGSNERSYDSGDAAAEREIVGYLRKGASAFRHDGDPDEADEWDAFAGLIEQRAHRKESGS